MADYSPDQDQSYCVEQCLFKSSDGQIPGPRLIIKSKSFIESLINGMIFKHAQIETENFRFTIFPSKKDAEEYLDSLSMPRH